MHLASAKLLAMIYAGVSPESKREVTLSIQEKEESPEKAVQKKLPFTRKGRLSFRKR
jgi:hypothetical protein